jgi:uncharacterized membrane protein
VVLLCLPALLAGGALEGLVPLAMDAWSPFCHQDPQRSIHLDGVPLLACARCTGIFAGALAGMLAAPLSGPPGTRRLPVWALLAGAAPMALDAGAGLLGAWTPTLETRALTGAAAGASASLFLLAPAVDAAAELIAAVRRRPAPVTPPGGECRGPRTSRAGRSTPWA